MHNNIIIMRWNDPKGKEGPSVTIIKTFNQNEALKLPFCDKRILVSNNITSILEGSKALKK